jgi:hypothetical protein
VAARSGFPRAGERGTSRLILRALLGLSPPIDSILDIGLAPLKGIAKHVTIVTLPS